ELALTVEHLLHLVLDIIAARPQQLRDVPQHALRLCNVLVRALAGDGFDATHTGSHATLAHDLEQADIADPRDVRPAAQPGCTHTEAQHPHVLLVLTRAN